MARPLMGSQGRKNKLGTVYALVHVPTGKVYVGSSGDVETRITTHISKLRNHCHPCESMQKDFDNYGDGYRVYILFQGNLDREDLREVEFLFMSLLHTRNPNVGYNDKDASHDFCLARCSTIKVPDHFVKKEVSQIARREIRSQPQPAKQERKGITQEEITLIENLSKLPDHLQDRFLAMAEGAVMMLDHLRDETEKGG